MKVAAPSLRNVPAPRARTGGSVLIIVLWISFGLVAVALYFANSMSLQLRAADNRVAAIEAGEAITGAARYVSNLLATTDVPGMLPDIQTYQAKAVLVGDAMFWLIGRSDGQGSQEECFFGLVDEASKLNLNTATVDMLQLLPRMTPELAAAIVDWRDANSEVSSGGAENDTYQRLNPPYRCKDTNFETIDELRLVAGMNLEILFGEDANLNGTLDPNENDADLSPPNDNRDGRLDPGILEYVTVFTREPTTRTNGSPRINVANVTGTNQQALLSLLQERFGEDRARQIVQQIGTGGARINSVLAFYMRSGMSLDEFAQIEPDLTASATNAVQGLVNVNTASAAVLACIPGIGVDQAPAVVAYRQSNRQRLPTLAWVAEVLGTTNAIAAGPYLTGQSYQFTADVAALGHHGRGFQRVKFIFDTADGAPRIVYRQDLTHLGWALGKETRNTLLLARERR